MKNTFYKDNILNGPLNYKVIDYVDNNNKINIKIMVTVDDFINWELYDLVTEKICGNSRYYIEHMDVIPSEVISIFKNKKEKKVIVLEIIAIIRKN